jgi:hypothetical protein
MREGGGRGAARKNREETEKNRVSWKDINLDISTSPIVYRYVWI